MNGKKRKTSRTPLKNEYKGKLIFAQSGAGKTSIADNIDVIDSDFILASLLNVPTPLAKAAFRLLDNKEKERIAEKYREAILEEIAKGKTVVTVLPDTAERYFSTPLFE